MTKQRREKTFCYAYPRPALTVDLILYRSATRAETGAGAVLLIRRTSEPFADCWALPGGFVDAGETLEAAARRECHEETGVTPRRLAQWATFGDPGRDPRGWTVSVVFYSRIQGKELSQLRPVAGDDATEVCWWPWSKRGRVETDLAFDHAEILKSFCRQKLAKPRSTHERH